MPRSWTEEPVEALVKAARGMARRGIAVYGSGRERVMESVPTALEARKASRIVALVGARTGEAALRDLVAGLLAEVEGARVVRFATPPQVADGDQATTPAPTHAECAAFNAGALDLPADVTVFDYPSPVPGKPRKLVVARRVEPMRPGVRAIATREVEFGDEGEVIPIALESVVELTSAGGADLSGALVLDAKGREIPREGREAALASNLAKRISDPLGVLQAVAARTVGNLRGHGQSMLQRMTTDVDLLVVMLSAMAGPGARVEGRPDGSLLVTPAPGRSRPH